ncbi:hypothetical protein ZIOFF_046188 [Zingiber officinale]|uniref:Uncharacterized protein n=1 Tax=Zingiber officinale TaxID=94328 RepID=A0A8J5G1U0_ZINOF|nr:hypothetical protein ZIOFF_046188 [Zingiber officinale]
MLRAPLSFCMDAVPPESMRQHGRRLCELLEDQQELLEHDGYSDRAVNSAACICWFGSACRRLKRLSNYGFKRKKKVEAIRLLIKRAWRWHAAAIDRVTKINSHCVKFHRLSSSAVADEAEMDKEERSPVSATDLLASLDVLDGDELLGLLIPHQPGDPEVPRPDVLHQLVSIAVVHYRQPDQIKRPLDSATQRKYGTFCTGKRSAVPVNRPAAEIDPLPRLLLLSLSLSAAA